VYGLLLGTVSSIQRIRGRTKNGLQDEDPQDKNTSSYIWIRVLRDSFALLSPSSTRPSQSDPDRRRVPGFLEARESRSPPRWLGPGGDGVERPRLYTRGRVFLYDIPLGHGFCCDRDRNRDGRAGTEYTGLGCDRTSGRRSGPPSRLKDERPRSLDREQVGHVRRDTEACVTGELLGA